jgi:hypothetical protein
MKNILTILMISAILLSCGETSNKAPDLETTSKTNISETVKTESKNSSNNTLLCKINGQNWEYTTGEGIVSRNSSTNVRTATIGFRKQLDKGYESVQLEYDVDKNVLNNVWVQLKRPSKDGKIITAFYTQYGNKIHLKPEASLSGTVTLNEETRKASGTAAITIFNDYEQEKLSNPEDLKITISELRFSDAAYSDTDDLKKLMKK